MATVQANYILSFTPTGETYVLDDSTRDVSNGLSVDIQVNPSLVSGNGTVGGNGVFFEYNNRIKIKRVRVDAPGAPGLQRPYNVSQCYAAVMYFNMLTTDGNNTDVGAFILRVPDFGTWFDCNVNFMPFNSNVNPAPNVNGQKPVKLQILQYGTSFNYDGYKMSADYVGQNWRPVILMDVETSGVYDSNYLTLI